MNTIYVPIQLSLNHIHESCDTLCKQIHPPFYLLDIMSSIGPAVMEELYHCNEEEMIDVLSNTDLQSLSKDLVENVVITRQLHEVFDSLDHTGVKSRTRARYLVSLVMNCLKYGHGNVHDFCRVLSNNKAGPCVSLARKIKQQICNSNSSDTILSEDDVEFLLEFLVKCSYLWEELGTMLKLPKHAIEECRLELKNKLKLKQVLVEWLSGAYQNSKESTLENLKAALESKTVAQNTLASSIEDSYRTHFKSQSKSDTTAETNIDRIIRYQSSSTEVADHKSALL